jgi:hypothetical protein
VTAVLSRKLRSVILVTVLAVAIVNIAVAVATRRPVPPELYGILGTIGGYILLQSGRQPPGDDGGEP